MIVGYQCEHDRDDGMALEILDTLTRAYPGHAWFVMIKGGVVHIKQTEWQGNWGMCIHYNNIVGDAKVRKQKVIRAAGEFLERARKARGERDDAPVQAIEGVPDSALARHHILAGAAAG